MRQSDFEVFQALAKDSEDSVNSAQKEYSQDIPVDKPWGAGPPVLPPHLLQVILNKDTPLSVSILICDTVQIGASDWEVLVLSYFIDTNWIRFFF